MVADLESENLKNTEYLRSLAEIAQAEGLSELQVESGGVRITLKAPEVAAPVGVAHTVVGTAAAAVQSTLDAPGLAQAAPSQLVSQPGEETENLLPIVSPMVGVFYRAPTPADPNFVEVGDRVEPGQTVALVEAMKVFNEIISEVAGTVVEIKAESSELVETGQVLITLRP